MNTNGRMYLSYAVDQSGERFFDKPVSRQIEEHVHHEASRARVRVGTADHDVALGVQSSVVRFQVADHLRIMNYLLASTIKKEVIYVN